MKKKNDIFFILKSLYTRADTMWMLELDIDKLSSYTVYLWLSMSQDARVLDALAKIDKFMFVLSDFEQLLLLHVTVPKGKQQFNKFVKQQPTTDDLDFLYEQIQTQLEYSDREFVHVRPHIERDVKKDLLKWFKMFGVEDSKYKKFGLTPLKVESKRAPSVGVNKFEW